VAQRELSLIMDPFSAIWLGRLIVVRASTMNQINGTNRHKSEYAPND
jgi:hypothetical protein